MDRVILHCDLNSFYASVEELYHPEYKNVPLAVGGSEQARHGIILAKNQLAKKYKIQTAEPIWQAKQKCPNLVVVPPSFDKYVYFSNRVREIFQEYTDLIEPFGIDEAWLDVTGSQMLFGDGKCIADTLRMRIKEELGITASVGVSFNKIFAKLGSDYKKPDATTVITRENKHLIVDPLPVEDLLFVGKSATKALHACGIYTIGQLANTDCAYLEKVLGKMGKMLWCYANGLDTSEVKPWGYKEDAKSISHGMTTKRDIRNVMDAKMVLSLMAEEVTSDMRIQKVVCKKVCLFMRDVNLRVFQRQCVLPKKTQCASDILDAVMKLLSKHYDFEIPLRSIGIRVMDFESEESGRQLSLFEDAIHDEKGEQLEKTVDLIRKRYGFTSIKRGSMMEKTDLFD
ncbi:MAG: DNA polymerase IV [Erysipelotrichaceae bacterium]|nr:DNA polymerase IV [Erysipelotrichaceae bacterium]